MVLQRPAARPFGIKCQLHAVQFIAQAAHFAKANEVKRLRVIRAMFGLKAVRHLLIAMSFSTGAACSVVNGYFEYDMQKLEGDFVSCEYRAESGRNS